MQIKKYNLPPTISMRARITPKSASKTKKKKKSFLYEIKYERQQGEILEYVGPEF